MRKLHLFITILLFSFNTGIKAQIAFSTTFGGSGNEDGRWMEQMPDSGFILTGGTTTYSNGQTDFWLLRTDKYGNELWRKSIGGTAFDFANMVKPVSGGFVVCGVTNRNGDDDAIIVKTDNNGNTLWTTVEQDTGTQWYEGFIPTVDGGYAAVGVNTGAGTHGFYDIYLVKYNANGVRQWRKSLGGQSYEIGNSIQQTADGGFIIGGQTYSYGNLDGDFYLVKTDSLGNQLWDKTFPQPHLQECHYAQITPDGGYILVGDADTLPNGFGDTDIWLIKTDSAGNMLWDKVLGGSKKDGGKTVENTSDGGFVIGGITRSFGLINPNFYMIKTDVSGNLEWQVTSYGTAYHDHAYRALETSDFGFAEFGYFRDATGAMDFSLVKLGPNGGITRDLSVESIEAPLTNMCRTANVPLSLKLTNFGATNELNIPVSIEISDNNSTTLITDTFIGSLSPTNSTIVNFNTTYDFTTDGTYNLKAYTHHRNGDISYSNDTAYLTVTVLSPVADPVPTSAISCVSAAVSLTSTPAAATDSMFWFDNAVNGNLISTGTNYTTPTLSNTATYYVQSKKGKGSMVGPVDNTIGTGSTSTSGLLKFDSRKEFILVSVKVYPTTAGLRIIELRDATGALLQQKAVTLPIAPGGIRVYLNFPVPIGNDLTLGLSSGSASLFKNSSGAVYTYSVSQTVEIYGTNSSNAGTYYYFYDWYIFVQSQSCVSNRVPVQAVITNSTTTAFDKARCGSGTVTLTANSNYPLSWYSASSGGSLLGSGTSFTTPSLSNTTTYYLENSGCPNRYPVSAIINNISAPPTATDVIHCGPGAVTLNATSPDPVSWYSSASNGVLLSSGSQYITPYLNSTTTYYAVAGNACPSTPVSVQAIIDAANPPFVSGATACGPASVTLSATSPDPVRWYTVPTGGSVISTSNNYSTPILANPQTYYVETGQTCSSIRVPVTANIIVSDPPVGTNASRCGPGSLVLSAQSANTISWWSSASGGSQIGSGATFTTPTISATTSYYAMSTVSGCTSSRTAVVATVNVTTPPSVTPAAHCGPGTVTLSATSSDTVYWYSAPSGGSPLANGLTYTTPTISSTTTYYAQASLACPSTRTSVNAVISSQAAAPLTSGAARCGIGSVTITATSPDPITWYDAPGGTVVGTGSPFQTPSLNASTTFYAVAGITGCVSSAVAAVATVNPIPADPTVTGNQNCGPGSLTLNAAASNPITWYSQSTGGSQLATGTFYTSNFSSTTTVYVEANDGTCSSNRVPVTAAIYSNPVVNLGPAAISINQGQTIVLDGGAGYSVYAWNTGATTRTISVSTDGTYYVYVTDAHGCHGSDTIVVNVIPNGITTTDLNNSIELFPNPSSGIFTVKVNNTALRFNLTITDIIGKAIITDNHKDNSLFNRNYDLSSYAKGMYFLRIASEVGNTTRTLIIQ